MGKLIFIILVLVSKVSYSATQSPRWEVRTAPIAFLANWITVDFTYIANDNWAFGPSLINYANKSEYGNMLGPTYYGKALGAHFIWAESFKSDALYVGGHYYSEEYTSRPHAFSGQYDVTGSKVSAVIGRRALLGSNFSSMAGIGYEIYNHDETRLPDTGTPTVGENNYGFFHVEFKIGYYF